MTVLNRKLLRTLWGSRGQSIAVAMVVLCGTACYIAIASAYSNLLLTRDTYYAAYRFADFEMYLERAPVTAVFKLESLPGVRQVRGRIVQDVNLDIDGVDEPRAGRIISMPVRPEPVLNDIHLMAGRYFSEGAQNEVILSERFGRENNLTVGDTLRATIDNKKYALRIVGLALSPEHVYMIRNAQELIPNPAGFGVLWVPEDFAETALSMREACNNVIGSIESAEEVETILDRAERLLEPYGVIAKIKAYDQISNRFISDEIQGLKVMARIIPAIFQGIAALILLVLLNRMVRKERTEIGLLKAYGHSSAAVAWYYIKFALFLSAAGSLLGFALGQWLANGMIKMYVLFYEFPLLRSRVYPDILARSMGIALLFSVLGAVMASIHAARIHPAESMRPEAPRYAHRTWFERIDPIWRGLSFTWKMILRNVSRNAFRAALNVFGVMMSTGLMMMGFFTMDSIDLMMDFQFKTVQREDVRVSLVSERDRGALRDLARLDQVRRAEPLLEYPFSIRSEWRAKDVGVIGLARGATLQRLVGVSGQTVDIGDSGLVISDKLADVLSLREGDSVTLRPLTGKVSKDRTAVVSQVVQQYLGMSAYMNIDSLSRLLDEPYAMNAALLQTDPGKERDVNITMKDMPGVAAVIIKAEAYQSLMDTFANNMNVMNTVLLLFSAVIACSIIYNVTSVSLAERQRELASLRVLGFSTAEVGRIMYLENFLLAGFGLALGIPTGYGICSLLVLAYDNEMFRMPFYIAPKTYVYVCALTVVFVLAANWAVHFKVRRLDMVEVLKERE